MDTDDHRTDPGRTPRRDGSLPRRPSDGRCRRGGRWVVETPRRPPRPRRDGGRLAARRFRGGQQAADAALARLDLAGYADATQRGAARARARRDGAVPLRAPRTARPPDAVARRRRRTSIATATASATSCSGRSTPGTSTRGSGRRTGGSAPAHRRACGPTSLDGDGGDPHDPWSLVRRTAGHGVPDRRARRARPRRLARQPDADVGRIALERARRCRLARRRGPPLPRAPRRLARGEPPRLAVDGRYGDRDGPTGSRARRSSGAPPACARGCPLQRDCPIADWPEDPPLQSRHPPIRCCVTDPDPHGDGRPVVRRTR
jgi:hypothetical protein